MREVESNLVYCQTDYNVESKRNIKATLLLTCNEELDEYKHNYNMSKISKKEKIIIQSSTNDKNQQNVTTMKMNPIAIVLRQIIS